ncbi:SigE family RNA polymerase sigma factor [Actinosynnema sp. NPDC047251]|uniref:ECF subfamily RNA polymerase sigma-24 factor n=1 Tax=Saccharothrix espanaensis (strain ATCC 51144 / DSM 44229 / JCM 9112 / NBRC 15066 / NRRL 15764) TaxID=1179773 RepID=K0JXB6_SACES|nr:SigE family RNA polymerase sigma factor [Saccharothrix espanaensis]CCH29997.1 ECF subfamily RNA polymerase sigma-24 factor [Saccharothrix espanaensis DSM 44229]
MEFAEYVARQRPALMRFATVLTCRTWLAEDLVSDVLGRAFEHWARISVMAEPHAYVRRMVVNEYLSWRRRLTRTSPRAEVEPVVVSDGADERAERDAMIHRLAGLPRKQRAAVVLRYYAGLSDREIATELGCREPTVRSQIHRALNSLRIDLTAGVHDFQETS